MTVDALAHAVAPELVDLPGHLGAVGGGVACGSAGQGAVLVPQTHALVHAPPVAAKRGLAGLGGRDPQRGQQEEEGCSGQLHGWGRV